MNFAVVRNLNHLGLKNLNQVGLRNFRFFHKSINWASEPPKDPCACETAKPPDPPCPPKPPEPPPPPKMGTPQPPPCPGMPQCPPTSCPPFLDPGNPCNYCPPPCIDPDYPDLRRLKANQCRFQVEDDVPVFLKGGTLDTITFQIVTVSIMLSLAYALYTTFKSTFTKSN